jgi:hypothetical protein
MGALHAEFNRKLWGKTDQFPHKRVRLMRAERFIREWKQSEYPKGGRTNHRFRDLKDDRPNKMFHDDHYYAWYYESTNIDRAAWFNKKVLGR